MIREVREETGLEVEIEAKIGTWNRSGFRPHIAHVYRCRVVGGQLAASYETPRLDWFDPQDPPDRLFPWYRQPLVHALRGEAARTFNEWQGIRSIVDAMRIDLSLRWRGLPDGAVVAPRENDSAR